MIIKCPQAIYLYPRPTDWRIVASIYAFFITDSVTCIDLEKQHEVIYAVVGEPLVLNCTYNCSSGFVRGHWIKVSDCPHCPRPRETKNVTKNGDLCTLPLYFPHLSREDFQYNYTCFSEDHESEQFPRKIECLVSLQAQGRQKQVEMTYPINFTSKNKLCWNVLY